MNLTRRARGGLTMALVVLAGTASGCTGSFDSSSDHITDVAHTDVERQSIGNCWLYAQASWVESMHLSATGEAFDISQSYWTYWHWFDQILRGWRDEISTGGNQWTSNDLVRDRGLMTEVGFVSEDAAGEMSYTQKSALTKINKELAEGGRKRPNDVPLTFSAAMQLFGYNGVFLRKPKGTAAPSAEEPSRYIAIIDAASRTDGKLRQWYKRKHHGRGRCQGISLDGSSG